MNLRNHIGMGRLIYEKMRDRDMPLNKRMFLLGNIAPDLYFSYLYRPHRRAFSGANLELLLRRLVDGSSVPGGPGFSFRLGVMAHYVCDFFCYAHTPVFTGGVSEHIAYEKSQTVSVSDAKHCSMRKSASLGAEELADALDEYFTRHEQMLSQDAASAAYDIPVAIYITAWAASAAYLHAEEATVTDTEALPAEAVS